MDLEEMALFSLEKGGFSPSCARNAVEKLMNYVEKEVAEAIVSEILNSRIEDQDLASLLLPPDSGVSASMSGLGCRGTGDRSVHELIVSMLSSTDAEISSKEMDDAGAVRFSEGHAVISVDGIHSRLSRFPFIAGFHAARAALRDICVMGAIPMALFVDVHIGDDGDVGKVFDLMAGVSAVSEMMDVPVVAGSTLRIGGDLVKGSRLTGCVGAMGSAPRLLGRRSLRRGDVFVMTTGSGGGTIATTAIYHGMHQIVWETLNLDFLKAVTSLIESDLYGISMMTDITNGGIRSDAFDIARSTGIDIHLDYHALRKTVNPAVLRMLDDLRIDFLGISTDSLFAAVHPDAVDDTLRTLERAGCQATVVGHTGGDGGKVFLHRGHRVSDLRPGFREAPYTPVKRVIARVPQDLQAMLEKMRTAWNISLMKKERVKEMIRRGTGGLDAHIP